jgi:hypothetical protein
MKLLFSVATLMILKNCVLVSDAKLMIFANAICTIFISCLKCWPSDKDEHLYGCILGLVCTKMFKYHSIRILWYLNIKT